MSTMVDDDRRWPAPRQFDSDDRSTWPALGEEVLTYGLNGGEGWYVSYIDEHEGELWWLHESPERVAEATVSTWWPLPSS